MRVCEVSGSGYMHTEAEVTSNSSGQTHFAPTKSFLTILVIQARSSKDPQSRFFARLAVAGLPRGGGDGDAIRHGILNIMRENGIKEGHRPVNTVLKWRRENQPYARVPNAYTSED